MLGVLREDDLGTIPLSPVPSTTDIAGIVTRANEAGLAMSFRIAGTAITLSEAQETCLFRVVQESLTNVVKHTSGASGFVELSYSDEAVTVVIEDLGEPVPTTSEPGHGIEGMRERMSLFGGTLETRALGAAGFRVVASLPLVGAGVQG
jgi:signal transduction histidine kinase